MECRTLAGRNPAVVPEALHRLIQEYLDETDSFSLPLPGQPIPQKPRVSLPAHCADFWAWLGWSADVEAIIAMEQRHRAAGVTCDECGAPVSSEETRGIPPWTYCGACAFGDDEDEPTLVFELARGSDGHPRLGRCLGAIEDFDGVDTTEAAPPSS
jgi:hypothetical protein